MVGDRDQDMSAASSLALRPIGVLWGYGSRDELIGAGALDLVDSIGALSALLTGTGDGRRGGPQGKDGG
jgi:phosphoglycolate phosphatase